jgi:hypothetical protein
MQNLVFGAFGLTLLFAIYFVAETFAGAAQERENCAKRDGRLLRGVCLKSSSFIDHLEKEP